VHLGVKVGCHIEVFLFSFDRFWNVSDVRVVHELEDSQGHIWDCPVEVILLLHEMKVGIIEETL
jgi:hypothetical protein